MGPTTLSSWIPAPDTLGWSRDLLAAEEGWKELETAGMGTSTGKPRQAWDMQDKGSQEGDPTALQAGVAWGHPQSGVCTSLEEGTGLCQGLSTSASSPCDRQPPAWLWKGGCDGGVPHSHLHQQLVIRKLLQHQPLNSHGCRTSCPRPRRGKGEGDPAWGRAELPSNWRVLGGYHLGRWCQCWKARDPRNR